MAFQDLRKGKDMRTHPAEGVGTLTAFIDQGSEFTGKLTFKDTVRIDGRFEGEIASENTLIVGETGCVHADIQSEVVVISGEVRGDIHANRQITLHKTARVVGDLHTVGLAIEEGAVLNGKIDMGSPAPAKGAPTKDAKDDGQQADGVVKLRS